MLLVKHHTTSGQRIALIVKQGRKWLHVLYNGNTSLKRIPISEARHFRWQREATIKEIRQFNRFAKARGAKRNLAPVKVAELPQLMRKK